MIKTEFKFLRLLLVFGLMFFSLTIYAQKDKGNSKAEPKDNDKTLNVTSTGSLDFGKFTREMGGTITIYPDGAVTKSGDIFLVSSLRSNVRFDISTNRGNSNLVIFNASPTPLTGPGTLELSVFFDKTSVIIDKNNPATVYMGGTLTVGPEDLPGIYSGTVNVIFAYQ